MPLFFFRFVDGNPFTDPDGFEAACVDDARDEAVGRAVEVWADGLSRREERTDWVVEVLDESDTVVSCVTFADALEES